jgi:ketosteroid isomerase-like protein
MADTSAEIEALSLATMRAWVAGDAKALKRLTARDFMIMVGTLPPQLLDRPSFLAAAERGFSCDRFTLREVFVRRRGKAAWLVAGAELDLQLGGAVWSGRFMLTDLWCKGTFGGWKLAERSLARLESEASGGERLAKAVRALQMWT